MVIAPYSRRTSRTARPYQVEAIDATHFTLGRSDSALIVLPTGTGKTFVMARIVAEYNEGAQNVLLLAHRIELLEQAQGSFADEIGHTPVIEQGQRGFETDCLFNGGLCVIGSVATMVNLKRREKYASTPFDLILIDEAHHATARSYRTIVDYYRSINPNLKLVGVTATPRRADNTALGLVFDDVAYAMDIRTAIRGGWLVPIEQEIVVVDSVDFSSVRSCKNDIGEKDFRQADLETVMMQEEALQGISVPVLDRTATQGEQALIFTAGVAHAHMLADILNRHRSGSAAAVDGETDAAVRKQLVRDYQAGRLQYLCNFGVFTEGFDAPATSHVVMARPTKSQSLYIQMLGRGTRPLAGVVDGPPTPEERKAAIAASRKPKMLVMDFVGNTRHSTCTAVDILGGDYSLVERERAVSILKERGEAGDIDEALNEARQQLISEEESRARRGVKAEVRYQSQRTALGEGGEFSSPAGEVFRGGSSDSQIAFLVNLGVSYEKAAGFNKRQASAVIEDLKTKRCTTKQASILKRFGYDVTGLDVPKASELIDRIKANGWKRPDAA